MESHHRHLKDRREDNVWETIVGTMATHVREKLVGILVVHDRYRIVAFIDCPAMVESLSDTRLPRRRTCSPKP